MELIKTQRDKAFSSIIASFNDYFMAEANKMKSAKIPDIPENLEIAKFRALLLVIADLKNEIEELKKPKILT